MKAPAEKEEKKVAPAEKKENATPAKDVKRRGSAGTVTLVDLDSAEKTGHWYW